MKNKVEVETDAGGPYFVMFDEDHKIKIRPDFTKRFKIGLRSDLLAKAVGYKKGTPLRVIDATAGLCRDAYHLASLGCEVRALESNKMIFEVVQPYVQDFTLILADARSHLKGIQPTDKPDVIYLYPMFPEKKKSAKSSKESELLKSLADVPSIEEERELLSLALRCALKRVVVKRALHAPLLGSLAAHIKTPHLQIKGKAVRYDVYFVGS